MPNYLISGYYGRNNIGDEAILSQILKSIKEVDKYADFEILSYSPIQTQKMYNINSSYTKSPIQVLRSIFKCDCLIYGGGGHEFSNRKLSIYIHITAFVAKVLNKKVIAYAIGIEKTTSSFSKKIVKFTYNNLIDLLLLRDEESKERLNKWGIKKEVYVTADPVINYKVNDELSINSKVVSKFDEMSRGSKVVGICLTKKENEISSLDFSNIINYISGKGYKIVLIPMCLDEGDISIVEELNFKYTNTQEIYFIKEIITTQELYKIIKKCEFTIGMRFHFLVFSAITNVPFIALANSTKVRGLCTVLNQLNLINHRKEKYKYYIDDFIHKKEKYREALNNNINKLKRNELQNSIYLNKIIKI